MPHLQIHKLYDPLLGNFNTYGQWQCFLNAAKSAGMLEGRVGTLVALGTWYPADKEDDALR